MINLARHRLIVVSLLSTTLLTGCVVWKSDYEALQAKNQQLQQQVTTQSTEIAADKETSRLQGAIKYTVDSDLLFPPGGYQMSNSGKQIIAKMATKLAPGQQNKLVVSGYTDNAPIGPELRRQGITSNQVLSQKRAEDVMQNLISKGVKPNAVSAHGFGEASPTASTTAKGRAKN
jgi:chemotaxis protein MotB